MDAEEIRTEIESARRLAGWSYQRLAAALDPPVTHAAVLRWLSGDRRLPLARAVEMATLMGMRLDVRR